MTTACSVCGATKPPSRQSYCVTCNRAYGKRNYADNKQRYFDAARRRNKRLDELVATAKAVPCADCGIQYPPYVMDFDHLGDKEFNISSMRRRHMAFARIEAEIAKCEVVCSNCHRERTNDRNPSRYQKWSA